MKVIDEKDFREDNHTVFAGAILSELVNEGKLQVSEHLRVASKLDPRDLYK